MPARGESGARGSAYERLDPSKVTVTLTRLHARISATFPGRHLADVAIEVRDVVTRIDRQLTENAPRWRAVPNRVRRNRTLEILHRLRSLAHIVDMHEMNKDADELLPPQEGGRGGVGGADRMTRAELERYYDFCSELPSLTSKAATLCAEESTDAIVLETVGEIENLTTGMSRKIWQKISLLRTTATPLA